ncbi:hypothetical protein Pfo_022495 [Paulownia fortunei]|nr:hypothetical protein Pfo_022495 [Paulownia fortunei]
MDFKGITWAGNIYQKFEAMCLEVEEVMYQDTVKYMENQVHKVGVSVKKFYSEVMEDLLPPSCVDPMKIASCDLSLNPYAHTAVHKKPIQSILDCHRNLKKKENEDEVISDVTAEKESSLNGYYDVNSLSTQSPGVLVQNKCSESCSAKSKKVGVHRRPVGIKKISQNNHPSKDSRRMNSVSGDRSSRLASCDMRSSSVVASDDMNVMSSSDLDVRRDPGEAEKGNAPMPDTPIESPASDKTLSAESVRQRKDGSECISPASDRNLSAESVRLKKGDSECTSFCCGLPTESIGTSMNDVSFSLSGSSIRSNICNVESEDKEVMTSNEDTSMKGGSSNVSSITCNAESGDKEVIMSNEDTFDMVVIENEEAAEPRLEIFEPVERAKLLEICVLVERDELHCVPQGTGKHKPYKKKIREARSSKLRSRKHNQCVSQHKDLGGKSNAEVAIHVLAMDSEKRKLPAHDSFESDWELL